MNNRFRILLLFIVDSLLVVGSVFLGFRLVTEGLIRNIHGLTITAILSLIAYYIGEIGNMPVSMKSLRL